MDDLPSDVLLTIFERLPDTSDLANCRLASHRLLSLSYNTSSISLTPHSNHSHHLPFKTRVINLVSLLAASLVSVSVSGEDGHGLVAGTEEVDNLTEVGFLSAWIPLVCKQLCRLSIVNSSNINKSLVGFSRALALISDTCKYLDTLLIRNARLSFDSVKFMPRLTNLTLKFVKIDDEHVANFAVYFPSLKFLTLIHIINLKAPKIHLNQLQTFRFAGYPRSIDVKAPNLEDFKLRCMQPCVVKLDCNSVRSLSISVAKSSEISMVSEPRNLQNLAVKSLEVPQILPFFIREKGLKLKRLELEVSPITNWFDSHPGFSIIDTLEACKNTEELVIGPIIWYLWQRSSPFCPETAKPGSLSRIVINLPPENYNDTDLLMSVVVKICAPSEVELRFFNDVKDAEKNDVVVRMSSNFAGVKWSWSTSEKSSSGFFSKLWRGVGI